jgi:tellurite resistance protein TehA-like permease
VLGIWLYLMRGEPFAYDPLYWGGVFPLGMYSVATYQLTKILEAPFLMELSQAFMIIALAAWSATLLGFLDTRLNARNRQSDAPGRSAFEAGRALFSFPATPPPLRR